MAEGEHWLDLIVARNRRKGILVDTNLMLLLVVGRYRLDRIARFPRTRAYTEEDFHLVVRLVTAFDVKYTTPGILTEVDNLSRQIDQSEHDAVNACLRDLVEAWTELFRASSEVLSAPDCGRFGITDMATLLHSDGFVTLTDDARLANRLTAMNRDSININHLRTHLWS